MHDKVLLSKTQDIVLNPEEARRLLWAKALESAPDWKAPLGEAASNEAVHSLGEGIDTKRFLLERADRIIAKANQKPGSAPAVPLVRITMAVSLLLALVAFGMGIATEHLGNPGHHLNLLAFPLWGLVLWNLLVYIALIFSRCVPAVGMQKDCVLRKSLMAAFQVRIHLPHQGMSTRLQFASDYRALLKPWLEICAAKAFHAAAIAFALGLVASLVIRGVGTAYWACWESTWFADDISTVTWILEHTYGLVPAWGLITPMPDAATLDAIRADRLPFLKEGVSAAPWIARMLCIVSMTIIMPRLLLFWAAARKARRALMHLTVPASDPYIASAIGQGVQSAGLGPLVCLHAKQTGSNLLNKCEILTQRWGEINPEPIREIDFDAEESPLPILEPCARQQLVLVCLDAARTPEDDVEGIFIDRYVGENRNRSDLSVALLVDTERFSEQSKAYPERIEERLVLWKRFAQTHQLTLFTIDGSETALEDVLHLLRTWIVENPCLAAQHKEDAA